MIKDNTRTNESIFLANKKRTRSQTPTSIESKKSRFDQELPFVNTNTNNSDEYTFRKPLITNHNLPPITIEQLLGLRGDIPDVHNWSTDDLNQFFHQQGYEYASILLNKHEINGNKLYELEREQVFRMSTLKIGNALKLWNVIEQIQQKFFS